MILGHNLGFPHLKYNTMPQTLTQRYSSTAVGERPLK